MGKDDIVPFLLESKLKELGAVYSSAAVSPQSLQASKPHLAAQAGGPAALAIGITDTLLRLTACWMLSISVRVSSRVDSAPRSLTPAQDPALHGDCWGMPHITCWLAHSV